MRTPARSRRKPAKAKSGANTKPRTKTTSKAAPRASKSRGTGASVGSPPKKRKKVVLLSGGNPQIAKAEGDAPVQAYIAAIPGWRRDVARRLDALIVKHVPRVRKAVKWNSPFYGVDDRGWFLAFHIFTNYVKVTFFKGASLEPVPPDASKHHEVRYANIREGELDEAQMAKWVKQAAALPGWIP
jgi:hypothetical protein